MADSAGGGGAPAVELAESPSTPEELVARAIAPVKPDFICPPPLRHRSTAAEIDGGDHQQQKQERVSSALADKKKSKRQLKRERMQERKSAINICPELARTGSADACRFGGNCRFNHDVDAFLAQKPVDLEGICPFKKIGESCPYGLSCRFFNTHDKCTSSDAQNGLRQIAEINSLSKGLQKLLWKNKVSFPKADAQLKSLGISAGKFKSGVHQQESNPACENGSNNQNEADGGCSPKMFTELTRLEDAAATDVIRPSKKPKSLNDEEIQAAEFEGERLGSEDLNAQNGFEGNSSGTSCASEVDIIPKLHLREKKLIDFRGKLYLAPLTTVGNLPFRRLCKFLGADITCGEMAMCTNLLQGQASEWALLRRHPSEDIFGVQICGAYPDTVARTVELIERECSIDYIDINMGCPIDVVVNKGAGSSLLTKPMRMKNIIQAACCTMDNPLTVKVRTGYLEGRNKIHSLISVINDWGANALTIHGRSRQQRYSKLADWDYIYECAKKAPEALQVLGNGDVFSFTDWNQHTSDCPELSSCMIARGALIKPWIFTEIKEQRHWDISSGERFDIFKDFVNFGLEHWGSDSKGVETTRHFLLEWLSYTYRYVPVGLLDIIPQKLNWRPPSYFGRNDLETLMASDSAADWIRISEMLLGKVPEGFSFAPKHKSNAYDRSENG